MQWTGKGPLPVRVATSSQPLPSTAWTACPGKGLNYPDLCQYVFGEEPDNWLIGCYRKIFIGYSAVAEVRRSGASGGVITQTLLYLLEQGLIDGAVVVKQGQPTPWQAEPVIATTDKEILEAAQSIYVPVPVNVILAQVEAFQGTLAFVGLPDQVAALRQLQALGHAGAAKIRYVIGPYVGTSMYFGAIQSYLRSNGVRNLEDVTELKYREGEWPGYMQVKTRTGKTLRVEKFYYNYLIPFYITQSSLHSVDFTNELTDISIGDAWHPKYENLGQGFSVVVARSAQGEALLESMRQAGLVHLDETTLEDALSMHGHMLDFKKRGAFVRLDRRAAQGKPVPDYGYRPLAIPFSRKAVEMVISGIFSVCGTRISRRIVEFIPVSWLGPLFNVLRKTWKNASKPTKRKGLYHVEFKTWHSS